MADVKEIIGKVMKEIEGDPDFKEKLKANPAETIKNLVGEDLGEDVVHAVMGAIGSGKLDLEGAAGLLKGLLGK